MTDEELYRPFETIRPGVVEFASTLCDLCWLHVDPAVVGIAFVDGRNVCLPCLERFADEDPKVNQTIGLVRRGFYNDGRRRDPGPSSEHARP